MKKERVVIRKLVVILTLGILTSGCYFDDFGVLRKGEKPASCASSVDTNQVQSSDGQDRNLICWRTDGSQIMQWDDDADCGVNVYCDPLYDHDFSAKP